MDIREVTAFFRKKQFESYGSLAQISWRRFVQNRLSLFALVFIAFSIMIAIVGYLITPDPTPFANRQFLELGTKKPGFSVEMLMVMNNDKTLRNNFFYRMMHGQKSPYTLIPFSQLKFENDKIIVNEFTGEEDFVGKEISFYLPDVIYALSPENANINLMNDSVEFADIDGKFHKASITQMQNEIKAHFVTKKKFLLGTDPFGRDVLSRLLIGTRVSLAVGLISVLISLIIGILVGSLGGFFKGWVDNVVIWLINVIWSIPTLLLVIAITFALGKGFWQVFVAVGLTMWVEVARVTRGQILSVREKDYVEAARALGFTNFRIITRHVLPNVMGPVIVIAAANFASAILIEAGLSFLGIGVQPPMPSWGMMIRENYAYIILDAAYLAILPGLAIMAMVLAFMIIGNGLRDALDVKVLANRT